TGAWDNPVKEAETVNSRVDHLVDVIVANVDSPTGAIANAERRGIMSCGDHTYRGALPPTGFLPGAERHSAEGGGCGKARQTGGDSPNRYGGGFRREMVVIRPFGKAVPETVRAEVLKARQGFLDDTLKLYKGPLKDNEGNLVLKEGEVIGNEDNAYKLSVK